MQNILMKAHDKKNLIPNKLERNSKTGEKGGKWSFDLNPHFVKRQQRASIVQLLTKDLLKTGIVCHLFLSQVSAQNRIVHS